MKIWNSFLIAFSMYSKIPMPRAEWSRENMRYVMCFFPLVGVVLGALFLGLVWLCGLLGIGNTLTAVLCTLLPVAVSGGIHMDGLMDTMDALSSYQPKEKKLEILKDSRAGAFAVLSCCCYLLLLFGIYSELLGMILYTGEQPGAVLGNMLPGSSPKAGGLFVVAMGFVVSRALSGLAVVSFPCAKDSGLAAGFSEAAVKRTARLAMAGYLAACGAGMFLVNWKAAAGAWICALAGFVYYDRMSRKEFSGITGDLAGFFLQICELGIAAGCLAGLRL